MPNNPSSSVPPVEPLAPYFPSLQAELHELVSQIVTGSRKTQAMQTLANFDGKAKQALNYMDIGQQMLRDAHASVIHTLRSLLHDEVHGNNSVEHHDQPHTCDAGSNTYTPPSYHTSLLFFSHTTCSCMQLKQMTLTTMFIIYNLNILLMRQAFDLTQWKMVCLLVGPTLVVSCQIQHVKLASASLW
jgi:hypothetical protein